MYWPDEDRDFYPYDEEEVYEPEDYYPAPVVPLQLLPDFTLPVGIAAVLFLVYVLTRTGPASAMDLPLTQLQPAPAADVVPRAPVQFEDLDPEAFAAPYEEYVVTQGVHGASYGQMAVDIAAGKGAAIRSPINGVVTRSDIDRYGNPTLVIENEVYVVTLLHGNYTVEAGDTLRLGDPVGAESNRGYTTDMRGVPCAGRTDYCGYHTHINVFDKRIGENVNPLDLFQD